MKEMKWKLKRKYSRIYVRLLNFPIIFVCFSPSPHSTNNFFARKHFFSLSLALLQRQSNNSTNRVRRTKEIRKDFCTWFSLVSSLLWNYSSPFSCSVESLWVKRETEKWWKNWISMIRKVDRDIFVSFYAFLSIWIDEKIQIVDLNRKILKVYNMTLWYLSLDKYALGSVKIQFDTSLTH